MFFKQFQRNEEGFTLLEIVLGSFILGVLAVAVFEYWANSTATINYMTTQNEAIELAASSINELKSKANQVRKNNSDWNINNDLDFVAELNEIAGTEQVGNLTKTITVNELSSNIKKVETLVEVSWDDHQESITTVLSYNGLEQRKLMTDFQGQQHNVLAVDFSPDGSKAVTVGNSNLVKVWDVETGTILNEFVGHTDKINSVVFFLGGDLVISGSSDKTIKLWNLKTNNLIRTFYGHNGIVWDLAVSPDGTKIASASSDETVKVWNLKTGDVLKNFTNHSSSVRAVAFAPNGNNLVSGDFQGKIKLWNLNNTSVEKFNAKDIIRGLDFTSMGDKFISVGSNSHTSVWDLEQKKAETSYNIHSGTIYGVDCAPYADIVVTGSSNATEIKIWEFNTGKVIAEFNSQFGNFNFHQSSVSSVQFSETGHKIISGSYDGTAKVWSTGIN